VRSPEEEQTLQRFIQAVEKEYKPNPFHNFSHAVDVTHVVARLLRLMHSEGYLTDLEQFSLLVSAVAHDVGHPGVNNGFLSEVGHEVALMYNDRSCLENMHCAKLYSIVGDDDTNVFAKMTRDQYKDSRKCCIDAILHTDMMSHQGMVKDLQMIYQMNSEVFTNAKHDKGHEPTQSELEVFLNNDNKIIIMNTVLHSADVSNPCRIWEVTQAWAWAVLDEYFAQGDQEKSLGIPVQFLNDRDKLNKPNSQIGFIEFMISPFFAAKIRIWPGLHEFGLGLRCVCMKVQASRGSFAMFVIGD
jgi:cAMP-specific phosphodiesterase 4